MKMLTDYTIMLPLQILYAEDPTMVPHSWEAWADYSWAYPIFFCALIRLSSTPPHFLVEVIEDNPTVDDNFIKIITEFADATLFSRMYSGKYCQS